VNYVAQEDIPKVNVADIQETKKVMTLEEKEQIVNHQIQDKPILIIKILEEAIMIITNEVTMKIKTTQIDMNREINTETMKGIKILIDKEVIVENLEIIEIITEKEIDITTKEIQAKIEITIDMIDRVETTQEIMIEVIIQIITEITVDQILEIISETKDKIIIKIDQTIMHVTIVLIEMKIEDIIVTMKVDTVQKRQIMNDQDQEKNLILMTDKDHKVKKTIIDIKEEISVVIDINQKIDIIREKTQDHKKDLQ